MPRQSGHVILRAVALVGAVVVLASGAIVGTPVTASAAPGDGLVFGVNVSTHEASVEGWDEDAFPGGAVEIPAVITLAGEDYPVTSIGGGAFQRELDGAGLTSVVIPDSVRTIGVKAFANNMRLASAPLPAHLTTIGDGAFGLTGITSVTFPPSLTRIGSYAFAPTRLQSVDIPETVTSLGSGIFSGSGALREATLPDDLTVVPDRIFDNTGLRQIDIPDGVTTIGASAFNRTMLTDVTIPDGVVAIDSYAFASTGIADIRIPDTVVTIGQRAFYGVCPETVHLGSRVRYISEGAFNCPLSIGGGGGAGGTLAYTVIPASVESIGSYAFGSMHGAVDTARFLGDAPSIDPAPNGSFTTETRFEFCSGASGFTAPIFAGHQASTFGCTMATFEASDGTGRVAHQGSTSGPALLRPNPFTPSGCNVFIGWVDDGGQWYDEDSTYGFGAGITLHAQWEAATVALVSYNANGGTGAPLGGAGFCDTLLTEPTAPTKPGYVFAGWFADAGLTDQWDFATDRLEPRRYTLHAKWIPAETFSLTYAGLDGATNDNPVGYTIDDLVELSAPGSRVGYTFAGWTGPGITEPTPEVAFGPAITGARTYTANWTPVEYSIGYDLAGGVAGDPAGAEQYTIESGPITLTPPTRVGHTFAGWTGTDLPVAAIDVTIPSGSIGARSYTATWTIDDYTVVFDSRGGSAVADATVTYGGLLTEPTAPTRAGYEFAGWYRDADPAEAWLFASDVAGAGGFGLHARWDVVGYEIDYQLDGGTDPGNPVTYDVESATFALTAPARTGYRFTGWVGGQLAEPTVVVSVPSGSTGDLEFTATWALEHYALSYDLAGGSAVGLPSSYTVTSGPIWLTVPTRSGYRFTGWTGTGVSTPAQAILIPTGSTGDRAYAATWELVPVVVARPAGGSTGGTPDRPAAAPPVPSATPSPSPMPSEQPDDEPSDEPETPAEPQADDEPSEPEAAGGFPWWGWALGAGGFAVLLAAGWVLVARRRS